MHGANTNHETTLFILENSITLATGHAHDIEQLCTIDHVIV